MQLLVKGLNMWGIYMYYSIVGTFHRAKFFAEPQFIALQKISWVKFSRQTSKLASLYQECLQQRPLSSCAA